MPALRKDLTADSGSTFNVSVQYTDSSETPVDLTGYGASLTVLTTAGVVTQTLTGAVDNLGWMIFKATDEDTTIWPVGRQSYFIDLENPAGDVDRLFFGNVNVRQSGLI